jgi:hypothetical protein
LWVFKLQIVANVQNFSNEYKHKKGKAIPLQSLDRPLRVPVD